MKKLAIALLVVFLFAGVAMSDFIDHPRYTHINTLTASAMSAIDDAQAIYFANNSRYFQGIISPDTTQDGVTDSDVNWAITANDLSDSWKEFLPNIFKNNFKVPFQIRIDVYESPLGWGYRVVVDVWYAGLDPDEFGTYGSHWRYVHHYGPSSELYPSGTPQYDKWFIVDPFYDE